MASLPLPSVIVRDARPEDASHVAELGRHVFSITFGRAVEPDQLQTYLNDSYSITATAAEISNPSKDMIVAVNCENDAIIGFALLTRNESDPCIENLQSTVQLQRLYIFPNYQGKGVGKMLVKRLEVMAKEQGFEHLWLTAWEEHPQALRVYEKLGFKQVGISHFQIGGDIHRDQVMVKRI